MKENGDTEMITNIDVTLRDGGYRNSFEFSQSYAIEHARLSVESGTDWVEIGYRGGSINPKTSTGLTGRCDNSYIKTVADTIQPGHVGVMVHPHNLSSTDLKESFDAGAGLVRVCLSLNDLRSGFECAENAANIGYTVCVNVTRVSGVTSKKLRQIAQHSSDSGATTLYVADSNGSLNPTETANLIKTARIHGGLQVGFHAHNHLGLALANSISAINSGAVWIDSSVLGMGKGAGNLITEQCYAYLAQEAVSPYKFNIGKVTELSDYLRSHVIEANPRIDPTDILMGYFDLSVEHIDDVSSAENWGERVRIARRLAGVEL